MEPVTCTKCSAPLAIAIVIVVVSTIVNLRFYNKSIKNSNHYQALYHGLLDEYRVLDDQWVYFLAASIEVQKFFTDGNLDTPLEKVAEVLGYDIEIVISVCNMLKEMDIIKLTNDSVTEEEIEKFLDEI